MSRRPEEVEDVVEVDVEDEVVELLEVVDDELEEEDAVVVELEVEDVEDVEVLDEEVEPEDELVGAVVVLNR